MLLLRSWGRVVVASSGKGGGWVGVGVVGECIPQSASSMRCVWVCVGVSVHVAAVACPVAAAAATTQRLSQVGGMCKLASCTHILAACAVF